MQTLLTRLSNERRAGLDFRQSDPPDADEPPIEKDASGSPTSRTRTERDRDRILYTSAFSRLAYVTQVTASESGHSFHSRLSHSLKVAQVGRRNAERLRALARDKHIQGAAATLVEALDVDAIEASCLAHDLGHPPFGHIAEEVLQEQAGKYVADSFEGNAQSFRIVTRLAVRSDRPGLDLTRRTLDGLLKYPWRHWPSDPDCHKRERKWGYYADDSDAFAFARQGWPGESAEELPERSLEAEIMDWADDLTYAVHDVDDFFRAGLIPLDRLAVSEGAKAPEAKRLAELLEEARIAKPDAFPTGRTVSELVEAITGIMRHQRAPTTPYEHTIGARAELRKFNSRLITRYLEAFSIADDLDTEKVKLSIDETARLEVDALKMLVVVYVVRRPALAVIQHGQKRLVGDLFGWYYDASAPKGDRRVFPPSARERLESTSDNPSDRARVVIDLIAGLTETATLELHDRLWGGRSSSALDATAVIG